MDSSVDSTDPLGDEDKHSSCESNRVADDLFRTLVSAFLLVSLNEDDGDEDAGPFEADFCPLSLGLTLLGGGDGPTGSCGPTAATTTLPSAGPIAARLGGSGRGLGPMAALFLLLVVPSSTIAPSLRHCDSYRRNMSIKSGIGSASGLRLRISDKADSSGIPTRL